MSILTLHALVRAFPTPTVQLVFDCIQEILARNDSVYRHVFSTFSRVLVQVDRLGCAGHLLSFLARHVLSVLEERCE